MKRESQLAHCLTKTNVDCQKLFKPLVTKNITIQWYEVTHYEKILC